MVWEDADPWFHELVFQFGYPDVLILHYGGNSIDAMPLRRLQKFVKLTAFNILAFKLNCKIIWSQILPRTYYRQMFSHLAAENAEVRINSSMPNFIIAENGDYFNFLDLQKCSLTFYRDGNHLTDSAQTIFLMPFRMVCSKVYVKISRPFPRYQVIPVIFTFTFITQFCYGLGKFARLCRMSFDNR